MQANNGYARGSVAINLAAWMLNAETGREFAVGPFGGCIGRPSDGENLQPTYNIPLQFNQRSFPSPGSL
jgi:hypothetical protein